MGTSDKETDGVSSLTTCTLLFFAAFILGAVWFSSCMVVKDTTIVTHDSLIYRDRVVTEFLPSDTQYVNRWQYVHRNDTVPIHDTQHVYTNVSIPMHTGQLLDASDFVMLPDSGRLRMLYYDRANPFGYVYDPAPQRVRITEVGTVAKASPIITHGVILGATLSPDGSVHVGIGYGIQLVIGTIF